MKTLVDLWIICIFTLALQADISFSRFERTDKHHHNEINKHRNEKEKQREGGFLGTGSNG